jgi:plastocyanin
MPRRTRVGAAALVLAALVLAACGAASTPAPAATRVPGGSGPDFTVTAKGIAYDNQAIQVEAGQGFSIHFRNDDPSTVQHDLDIRDSSDKIIQDKPTVDGGKDVIYDYTGLPAGTYKFECSIHPIPAMTGTLTVK